MKLNLIQKPTEEIISVQDVKRYMRIDHDYDDGLLGFFIKATREAIEAVLQKSLLKQKWSYQVDAKDLPDDHWLEGVIIPLPKPPILNVEKVSVTYCNGCVKEIKNFEIIKEGGFYLHILRQLAKSKIKHFTIEYYAGIAENSDNVPYQLKLANMMLVSEAYQNRFSYDSSTFMPKSVEQILSSFRRVRLA